MTVTQKFSRSIPGQILLRIWLQLILLASILVGKSTFEYFHESEKGTIIVSRALAILFIWVGAWALFRVLDLFRRNAVIESKLNYGVRVILFRTCKVLLIFLALTLTLDSFGISVTPILASLGVGSIAIALALQDTLGNLFSGVYLYLDRPIMPGDYIRLDSGAEGRVVRIGWRSTHLSTGPSNTVVIPNSKVSSAIVTNFSLPAPSVTVTATFVVDYQGSLDAAEEAAILVQAKESVAIRDRLPIVRFQNFGQWGAEAAVSLDISSPPDQGRIKHELYKALKSRLENAGVALASPSLMAGSRPLI